MAKTIQQTVMFNASPDELFDVYVDSKKHSAAGGSEGAAEALAEYLGAEDRREHLVHRLGDDLARVEPPALLRLVAVLLEVRRPDCWLAEARFAIARADDVEAGGDLGDANGKRPARIAAEGPEAAPDDGVDDHRLVGAHLPGARYCRGRVGGVAGDVDIDGQDRLGVERIKERSRVELRQGGSRLLAEVAGSEGEVNRDRRPANFLAAVGGDAHARGPSGRPGAAGQEERREERSPHLRAS